MFGQKKKSEMTGTKGRGAKRGLLAVLLVLGLSLGACGAADSGADEASPALLQETGAGDTETVGGGASAGQEGLAQSAVTEAEQQGSTEQQKDGTAAFDTMEVHFMDVGQGDATLVKCAGQTLLIDAGTSDKGTAIQNYLNKQGVERLDYLVLTHPDSDHIGGAPVVITKFEIGQVLVSNFEKDNSTYRKLIQALDDKRLKASVPEVGSTFTLGSAVCTVLAPGRPYDDPNNASVALLIQNGENRFLFTGDAEEEAEQDIMAAGPDLQADVYKAGHHGSRTSSCEELLDAVSPEFAVISCGEGNSYGHPHAQTLNNLRARGIEVYRTDEQGSIVAISDGSVITWNAAPSDTWQAGEPTGSASTGSSSGKTQGYGGTGSSQSAQPKDGKQDAQVQDNPQNGGAVSQESRPQGEEQDNQIPSAITYVLNTKTQKFHKTGCSYLPTANRQDSDLSREEILEQGYEPCKKCNP